jgi:putative tricarboxylic transport membrane protein
MTLAGRDMACGAAGLAIALAYYALADALPVSLLSDAIGADGLPKSLALGLAVCSALLLGRAVLTRNTATVAFAFLTHLRALGIIALGALYAALAPLIGYGPAVGLLIAATALYFGTALNTRLIVIAAAGAAVFWAMFVHMLGVPMPRGTLWHALFQ